MQLGSATVEQFRPEKQDTHGLFGSDWLRMNRILMLTAR